MKRDGIAEPRSSGGQSRPLPGEIHVWKLILGAGGREAARAALGELLASYLGTAAAPPLARDEGGKPRLAQEPERLSFNLSHSDGLALVAVARGGTEVGIDVERLRPRRDPARLAARWLPALDAVAVAAAADDEREAVFHAAWTRHEARVKCAGTGLAGPPPPRTVVARQLDVAPGYAAAVAFDLAPPTDRDPQIILRDR